MRPEQSETKTEIETETKNLLWDQSSQLQVKVTQLGMFHFLLHTMWMVNRKWTLHLRWS